MIIIIFVLLLNVAAVLAILPDEEGGLRTPFEKGDEGGSSPFSAKTPGVTPGVAWRFRSVALASGMAFSLFLRAICPLYFIWPLYVIYTLYFIWRRAAAAGHDNCTEGRFSVL